MAVPQLALAGNNNSPMLKDAFSQQDQHGDLLATLVDLTKELVDGQAKLFQKLLLVMDKKDEDTPVASASGSVQGVEEEMTLGVKDLFAGAFIALTLWANELDKYIRAVMLPKTLKSITGFAKSIGTFIRNLFTPFKTMGADFLKKIKPLTDTIMKPINKLFTAIKGGVDKLLKPIQTFSDDIVRGFTKIGTIVKGAVSAPILFKEFKTIGGKIGAFAGLIRDGFNTFIRNFDPVIDFFDKVGQKIGSMFTTAKNAGTKFISFFDPVIDFFKSVGAVLSPYMDKIGKALITAKNFLSPVTTVLKTLGRWIGGPFTLALFALFDFVSGFIDGFKEGGIIEGLKEGGIALINGLINVPLDLLKKIIGWFAGKLGFEEFEKTLDSFSFADTFTKLMSGESGFTEWIVAKVKEMFEAIKLWIAEKIPGGNKLLGMLGLGKVSEQTLQEKKLADLEEESRTGEAGILSFKSNEEYRAEKAKEAAALREQLGMNNPTGAQLAADTQDVAQNREQSRGQAAPVVIQAGNGDTINNNNGTTLLGPSLRSIPDPNWMYDE